MDRETLIAKFISVEFSRFAEFYSKNANLQSGGQDRDESRNDSGSGAARYFINVGERDGMDWMILKDMLKESTGLGKEDIFKVETKDSFSFFSTEAEHIDRVLEGLKGANLEGREVRVELSGDTSGKAEVSPEKNRLNQEDLKNLKDLGTQPRNPKDPGMLPKNETREAKKPKSVAVFNS